MYLKWDNHIDSIVKKAQQRKFNLPQELLIQFYSAIIESVLCTSITVWFSSVTKSDLRRLRRVVRTAEQIIGTTLPTLQELYSSRVSKRAVKITLDPSHPSLNCYRLVDATELSFFIIFVFCSVAVTLLHCGGFCHENKFVACVNIPGNKAHSDSDSDYAMLYCHITSLSMFFFYSLSSVHLSMVWLLQHFYLILCKTS